MHKICIRVFAGDKRKPELYSYERFQRVENQEGIDLELIEVDGDEKNYPIIFILQISAK